MNERFFHVSANCPKYSFGDWLDEMMKKEKISCMQLGNAIGVSRNFITAVRYKKRLPSLKLLYRIVRFFECSICIAKKKSASDSAETDI